jgi:epoxyqueuosine reductase
MALSFSDEIKNYALDLGYCKVGITSTIGFEGYRKEVESRGEAHKFLINNAVNISRLSENLPKAKSIIVLAWDYMQNHYPENLSDKIGRVFLSRSYNPPANRIHGTRLQLLKDFLAEKGCNIIPNVFVPLRYAAAKAGIVNFGKNSFAYVDSRLEK